MERTDGAEVKKCAVCGETVETGIIVCPKCGQGVFETNKIHRNSARVEDVIVRRADKPRKASWLQRLFGRGPVHEFLNRALLDQPADCRIKIRKFGNVYNALSERLKSQGLSGSEITDVLWARLKGICPQCGWTITGEDLGSLWMMGMMGFDRVVILGPGRALRFGKGLCPNEMCSSTEIVLRWRL